MKRKIIHCAGLHKMDELRLTSEERYLYHMVEACNLMVYVGLKHYYCKDHIYVCKYIFSR
jgi:hypothetical protein